MIRTYTSYLLAVFLLGVQVVNAQQSLEEVFSQLDERQGGQEQTVTEQAAQEDQAEISTVENNLFGQGMAYYKAREYAKAQAAFEAVLIQDPYHSDAIKYLKKTALKVGANETKLQESSRAQALSAVDSAWNSVPLAREVPAGTVVVETASPESIAVESMTARLQEMEIDELDLLNVSIKDAVSLLNEKSRSVDLTGKGVNIVLLGAGSSLANERNITISLAGSSMYEALQYVVEMAGFRFDVRAKAVAVMPIGYTPSAELKMVSYDVVPEVGDRLTASAGPSGAEALFDDSPEDAASGPVNVESYFSIIDWPEGASAVYQPKFLKLFVLNTAKNIDAIETILVDLKEEALLQRSQQVEVEAKFVEFSEGALEELGFDWNVYGNEINNELRMNSVGGTYTQGTWPVIGSASVQTLADIDETPVYTKTVEGYILVDPAGQDVQNVFGSYQRDNRTAFLSGELQQGILAQMGGAPAEMLFGGKDFDLEISALEQEGRADVLSAPRVTTKSGVEAVIKVGEAHRYPQDWQVDTGQRTTPALTPMDWEDIYLGVVLRVMPMVDPERGTIDLNLQPDIKAIRNYDTYIVSDTKREVNGTFVKDKDLVVSMPVFDSRSVQTTVTIADGHTVVMGGLVDEKTETYRDQVPILGDIPLLGRFFRSEGTRAAKKNLTIFVKATVVDEQGLSRKQRDALREMATN